MIPLSELVLRALLCASLGCAQRKNLPVLFADDFTDPALIMRGTTVRMQP